MAVNNGIRDKGNENSSKEDNNLKTSVLDESVIRSRGKGTDEDVAAFIAANRSWIPSFNSFYCEFRAFFTVFTFLTRLPGPYWVDHHAVHLGTILERSKKMDREIQKETQPSSDSIFGDINNDMIESGKNLRRTLNLVAIGLLALLALFVIYLFF